MKFNDYMKLCRDELKLTQENLVIELHHHSDIFQKIDTNTFGRWERGTTKPPFSKQVKILEYFFEQFDCYFPFFKMQNLELFEAQFSSVHIQKFLGKHPKSVMRFPSSHLNNDDFTIIPASQSTHATLAFSTAINLTKEMYTNDSYYSQAQLKAFARHPDNLFLICEHNDQYLGHLFFLRLKIAVFQKIISFEMDYQDITMEDIATDKEDASYFSLSLFAMNSTVLSLLFIRFYASLLIHQGHTSHVGTVLSQEDAITMARNIHLKRVGSNNTLFAYSGSLKEIFLNEEIIKTLFD